MHANTQGCSANRAVYTRNRVAPYLVLECSRPRNEDGQGWSDECVSNYMFRESLDSSHKSSENWAKALLGNQDISNQLEHLHFLLAADRNMLLAEIYATMHKVDVRLEKDSQ